MARRRNIVLQMKMDILNSVRAQPQHPTRILQSANLSWRVAKRLLEELKEKRLVRRTVEGLGKTGANYFYVITPDGLSALQTYVKLMEKI
jgi:predicted transcriptional regulator